MKKTAIVIMIAVFAGTFGWQLLHKPATACAAEIAPQPCDVDYWRTLTARAWLETEREIVQNQNLIFKPDSVLEYTCFDRFTSHNAKYAGDIFVHTRYFGQEIIQRGRDYSMEKALQSVVGASLKTYIESNFNHAFLADRSLSQNAGLTDKIPEDISVSDYSCEAMKEIWKVSKCMNFLGDAAFQDTDGFYPFTTLQPGPGSTTDAVASYAEGIDDPRKWPQDMQCATVASRSDEFNYTTQSQAAANSFGNNSEIYPFRVPLGQIFEDVRDRLEPGQCSDDSGGAIMTGITVRLTTGETYQDGVCTNPGCSYDRSGNCE